jgi:uncharacterized protein involved in exopolysaccharide biosynthesis
MDPRQSDDRVEALEKRLAALEAKVLRLAKTLSKLSRLSGEVGNLKYDEHEGEF